MANIIAIVGRPNVGKSTLYNRLVEQRDAIMDDQSGVTRDRHYGQGTWNGYFFTVIDTGGYVYGSEDVFEEAIREQVEIALQEASVVLFMVDCSVGLTGLDEDFAKVLRRTEKPVIVVANKADNFEKQQMANEFYALGMDNILPVSSISGSGTGELLDEVVSHLPKPIEADGDEPERIPRIAVAGRPNAGKSSLINLLLNQNRSIVTEQAGTTRDAVDATYKYNGRELILTDTAGIRRKSRVKENVEFYSVLRAIKAIEESDVCVLVVDISRGLEAQDLNILNLAYKHKKGMVIMANKWDLIEKDSKTADKFVKEMRERLSTMSYIPIILTSVTEKLRILKVMEKALQTFDNRNKKVPTSKLNEVMLKVIESQPPPAHRGKYIRIKYITQLPTKVPTFAFFCNHPKHIKEPYTRYLENRLRENFDFEGVPIKLVFREK